VLEGLQKVEKYRWKGVSEPRADTPMLGFGDEEDIDSDGFCCLTHFTKFPDGIIWLTRPRLEGGRDFGTSILRLDIKSKKHSFRRVCERVIAFVVAKWPRAGELANEPKGG
jgi:hypothetical protein